MKITFEQSINYAFDEVYALQNSVEDKEAFQKARQWMNAQAYSCDIAKGSTRSKEGNQSQFTGYNWAEHYETHKHHIFYDFFKGALMNKYSRIVRGIDK